MGLQPPCPAADHMHVYMVNFLAAASAYIDGEPVALLDNLPRCRKLLHHLEHMAHHRDVLGCEIVHRRDMCLGHEQDMDRPFGIDVLEHDEVIVLMHDIRRY